MIRIKAQELIDDVARAMGWDPADLDNWQTADIKAALSRALDLVWTDRTMWWAEVMEERRLAFADYWSSTTAYTQGVVVFFPQSNSYWQCISSVTGAEPATYNVGYDGWEASSHWYQCDSLDSATTWDPGTDYASGALVTFDGEFYVANASISAGNAPGVSASWVKVVQLDPVIRGVSGGARANAARPSIGAVRWITDRRPSEDAGYEALEWMKSGEDYRVNAQDNMVVWVSYRRVCPPLVGDTWDATKAYTPINTRY